MNARTLTLTHAVHLGNCKGEKTREGTRKRTGTVEKGESGLHLSLGVPTGDQVNGAREETSLWDTEEDTADHEASEVLNNASECHNGTPAENKDTDIC